MQRIDLSIIRQKYVGFKPVQSYDCNQAYTLHLNQAIVSVPYVVSVFPTRTGQAGAVTMA